MKMKEICTDLAEEHAVLDAIVADLDEAAWNTPTPAEGWTIKDQISHLAYFDNRARLAATDREGFAEHIKEVLKDIQGFKEHYINTGRSMSIPELLEWWREERTSLVSALESLDPKFRIPWYGPPMSTKSHATARLMETWAHGQDIVDALGVHRPPTDRLRHIAHLGFTTFGWSFSNHKMEVPDTPVRLELTSSSGEPWTWGPEQAENIVRGPAEDFCLVVIQRRNIADTDIIIQGDIASQWMSIAQCFAGPGTIGPKPGTFPKRQS
jgi:uncharacterized protein (TIGR03084 family)